MKDHCGLGPYEFVAAIRDRQISCGFLVDELEQWVGALCMSFSRMQSSAAYRPLIDGEMQAGLRRLAWVLWVLGWRLKGTHDCLESASVWMPI